MYVRSTVQEYNCEQSNFIGWRRLYMYVVLFRNIAVYNLTLSDGGYYTCTYVVLFRNITVNNLTLSDKELIVRVQYCSGIYNGV